MRELSEIRQDINAVDTQIRELYLQRMSLALEVAQTKVHTDDKILKPERETEIIMNRSCEVPEPLRLKYIALLQNMMRASREYQYFEILRQRPDKFPLCPSSQPLNPQSICYQGVPGAYQELAAQSMFPAGKLMHVETWEQVFQMVHMGQVDAGVVPVENTTAGTVSEVYDLLSKYDLRINRTCIKPIVHCLAAAPCASIESIREVCSHPHALPQCNRFIEAHGYTRIEMANTAMAAQHVAKQALPSLAAICSPQAAEKYGLTILARGINDHGCNETRFIAVSRQLTALPADNRIEIMFHLNNEAGALSTVLSVFADYGVDMTEIHSRPMKDSPWSYVFYIDFTGNLHDPAIRALLYQLHEELPYLKIIGSYDIT